MEKAIHSFQKETREYETLKKVVIHSFLISFCKFVNQFFIKLFRK